ncbi:Uncharacterised protein [Mycobacteroides abscessus subsp. abscessus]|nr:Uncharacterised protein [Mycobacteroides abscessus]SHS89429.1 Uncharacterised protein [Mycobacteroides abscessus subsp. abscessus]
MSAMAHTPLSRKVLATASITDPRYVGNRALSAGTRT